MSPLASWLFLGGVLGTVVLVVFLLWFDVDLLGWFPDQARRDVDEVLRRDRAREIMKSWQGEEP